MSGNITNINRLLPGLIEQQGATKGENNLPEIENKENFTEIFSNLIDSVNTLQMDSSQIQEAFMSGEPVELHQIMIKAKEAGLGMDLLLEIRNKLLNAYQELMRMPI